MVPSPAAAGGVRFTAAAQAPPPSDELAIQTRGLTKRYGELDAVDDLSISVRRGRVVGFVGPNGAGKTTTIRMLLGLIRPTAGDAHVLGVPVAHKERFLPRVGALIEAPAFYPTLSGEANLRALCRLGGLPISRVDEVLDQVGLGERGHDAFKGYSLGMKQRLGIAAALLPDPDLMVLDEPTNGLDPAGIREMRTFLRRLGDEGKTVFVSSHLLSEIQRMCDDVVILRRGRLVFEGTMDALMSRATGVTASAEDPSQHTTLAAIFQALGYEVEVRASHVLVVGATLADGAALNRAAFDAGITLSQLHAEAPDLERTVLSMTGEGDP